MSPKYKLTYFNAKGLAESIRFILSYMEEDFEDIRIEKEEWGTMKLDTPFGKLPLLEEDGQSFSQSISILRYLGKKAGLAGKDDMENLQIDIIADTITDLRMPIAGFMWEPNEDIKKAKMDTYLNETLPFYMKRLDAVVKKNGGYLANKRLTWVDLFFSALTDFLSVTNGVADVTADYPNLHALKQTVFNLPMISKWVAKRPQTHF